MFDNIQEERECRVILMFKLSCNKIRVEKVIFDAAFTVFTIAYREILIDCVSI